MPEHLILGLVTTILLNLVTNFFLMGIHLLRSLDSTLYCPFFLIYDFICLDFAYLKAGWLD